MTADRIIPSISVTCAQTGNSPNSNEPGIMR